MGGGSELCPVMEGYGEALSKCVFKGDPSLFGLKVTVSWVCTGSWSSRTETNRIALLGEEHTVLQMQESSKDAPATSQREWGVGC